MFVGCLKYAVRLQHCWNSVGRLHTSEGNNLNSLRLFAGKVNGKLDESFRSVCTLSI